MRVDENRFLELALAMRSKLYHAALAVLWNDQDAADAVQEAMLKGWKRRHSLRDEARFEPWFMRILINQCRDELRRRKRGRALLESCAERERLQSPTAGGANVLEALRMLPEEQRLPALLHYFHGYPMRDVAGMLKIRPELARSRLRAARKKLKTLLTEGDESHE